MHRQIYPLALLALAAPLPAQAPPDAIDRAIAEGVKSRDCRTVSLLSASGGQYGKSNYVISLDGPMLRVSCRAAGAARRDQAFERSMLSAIDTSSFYAVTSYPNGELRPHLIAKPSHLVLRIADSVIQPDSVVFAEVSLRDAVGGVLVVPKMTAYFLPARWPAADFQISVTTSGPEYRAKVGKSERARIR